MSEDIAWTFACWLKGGTWKGVRVSHLHNEKKSNLAHLRLIHVVQDIPDFVVRYMALNQGARGPSRWYVTLI